eukprot:Hpha_TRINITY_DN13450_c0_g3::TRINITY_DN13450_c0_g3_i1::g.131123::m.131123
MALVCRPVPPPSPRSEEYLGVRLPALHSCIRQVSDRSLRMSPSHSPTDSSDNSVSSVESLPSLPTPPSGPRYGEGCHVRFARLPSSPPTLCPRPPASGRPRRTRRGVMLRIPSDCKAVMMSADEMDRRRLVAFLLALRRLGCCSQDALAGGWARNRRNLWLCSDLMGDVIRFLVRRCKPSNSCKAIIVDSGDAPALNGRYTLQSGASHEGLPVWSCGRRRLYSNQGFWCVVHGEENMKAGASGLSSAERHHGQMPPMVHAWRQGSCVPKAAAKTVVRTANLSPQVWLSPDCG